MSLILPLIVVFYVTVKVVNEKRVRSKISLKCELPMHHTLELLYKMSQCLYKIILR